MKRYTWEDLYFDGEIDFFEESYCEETGEIITLTHSWDDYEELYEEEYIDLWGDDEEELNG